MYGSLPIGFIYLLYLTKSTKENGIHLSYNAAIGGLIFALYAIVSYLILKYTSLNMMVNVLFIIIIYASLIFTVKKCNLIF